MKAEFFIFPRKSMISWAALWLIVLFSLAIVFLFPFFKWFIDKAQPFSFNIFIEYLHHTLTHFPVSEKQSSDTRFILIYISIIVLIEVLKSFIKLKVTPEKIYYSCFNIPLGKFIQRKDVEYCQFTILHTPQQKWIAWLQRPIFKRVEQKKEAQLFFFPMKSNQYILKITHLSENEKLQLIQLLKQYYNFQEDIVTVTLSKKDLQNLMQAKIQTKISPRIAYLLISSIPIGIFGLYLNAQANFFYISNYPILFCLFIIFLLIFIPSFLWIQKDIQNMAFLGSILSSLFLTLSLTFFLLPILHSYYAFNFGIHKLIEVQLLSMDANGQKWLLLEDQQTFQILPKTPFYNPHVEINKIYEFPVYYHWNNYHFQHNDLSKVQLKTK